VQVRKSTGHTDKTEARKELAKIEAMLAAHRAGVLTHEVYQQLTGQVLPDKPLKGALDNWIAESKASTGQRTVEKYNQLATELIEHFHATDQGPMLSAITRDQLHEFLTQKRATVSAGTANMARKCLSIFFGRCRALGLGRRDNPVDGIKPFKADRNEQRARRPFTLAELGILYQKAPDDFWRYMILAGFFTGLRLGDLVTMPVGAVDFKTRTINILTRKTQTQMQIPIAEPLFAFLKKLKAERKGAGNVEPFWPDHAKRYEETGSGWFGQRFYDLVLVKAGLVAPRPHRSGGKTKADKRRVSEVSFHCFRHSYVSTLAALGQNQQVVKALSGHDDTEINDLYTKLPADVLRKAVAMLPDITRN
jgi:integrase